MERSAESRIKIADILPEEYQDFLFYCSLCGKQYSDEITATDYVTYSSEFAKDPGIVRPLSELITGISFVVPRNPEDDGTPVESVLGVWNSEVRKLEKPHRPAVRIPEKPSKTGEPTYAECLSVDPKAFSEISLDSLRAVYPFASRSINCLLRASYRTLEQLLNLTPSKLKSINGLGKKLVEETQTLLAEAAAAYSDGQIDPSRKEA